MTKPNTKQRRAKQPCAAAVFFAKRQTADPQRQAQLAKTLDHIAEQQYRAWQDQNPGKVL